MPVPVSATSSSTYSPGLKPCSRNFWLSAVVTLAVRIDELAAVRHGVARVDGEVHDHLLELVQVGLDRPDVAAVLDLELDRLAEQPGEQHRDVGERLVELDHLRPQRLPARERQQLPHQPGGAVGVLLDVHDVLEGRIGRPVVGEEQVGEADDGGQHVVEVVRDAAGELADRLHLLALRELQLERPLLGGLERVDDGRVLAVVAFQDRADEEADAPLGVVGEAGVDGGNLALPGDRRADRRRRARRGPIPAPAPAEQPPARALLAEEHHEAGVGERDPALAVDRGDRHRRVVEEAGEAHLGDAAGLAVVAAAACRGRACARRRPCRRARPARGGGAAPAAACRRCARDRRRASPPRARLGLAAWMTDSPSTVTMSRMCAAPGSNSARSMPIHSASVAFR